MELYELVGLRNQLEPLTAETAKLFAQRELSKVGFWADKASEVNFSNEAILNQLSVIDNEFNKLDVVLDALKAQINSEIKQLERRQYLDSYKRYKMSANEETLSDIAAKQVKISDDDRKLYDGRISMYSKWQYPGLIIRPIAETFMNLLVSYQPLYIVDHSKEILDATAHQYNQLFQQRLRQYIIKDFTTTPSLADLPDKQFGMVFAYGYFNTRPIEIINDYLDQLFAKLKAGGILIMTFNDCDTPEAIKLAESGGASYVPGRALKNIIKSIGYEIVFEHKSTGGATWIELKKPGKLHTLKAGPTLAKIVALSN